MSQLTVTIKPGTLVEVQPLLGESIEKCQEHSRGIAIMLRGNVKLVFNTSTYLFDPKGNMIEMTKQAWE